MNIVELLKQRMSLRDPQFEALSYLDAICLKLDFKTSEKEQTEKVASENCENKREIKIDAELDFPSYCFSMATGMGKTRLMGAAIYYLYKTKGYRHFFILAPGNTIYDKLRKEAHPSHPKYIFKGLEGEIGEPRIYDGENYINYPAKFEQLEIITRQHSDIELFIFNIGKIFKRGDKDFEFHSFKETLGGSFADVLRSFDDLVVCMDEAHRYYAPASKIAINHLNPVLGLEFTATPKSTNKNIIYTYDLAKGAGKYLKVPVVVGRSNTTGYSQDDIEEMKLKDGIRLHEQRKNVVYTFCEDKKIPHVKPIVLVSCKDTNHASKVRAIIDSDEFFEGKYRGKVMEIHSGTGSEEAEENIRKLLTIEENTNPIEIILHVYQLKEGWDVNNLFTIIPLNAAKSDILALQTIGRGLRLPFGVITGTEELDTLEIVAHEHYREIIDDVKNNPVFKSRNLDERDVPETKPVEVNPVFENEQISLVEQAFRANNIKSSTQVADLKTQEVLYQSYLKSFVEKNKLSVNENDYKQLDLFGNSIWSDGSPEVQYSVTPSNSNNSNTDIQTNPFVTPQKQNKQPALTKEKFIEKINMYTKRAIDVPRISMSYNTSVKFNPFKVKKGIANFENEVSMIERYDVLNNQLLQQVEAVALKVDDPQNALACLLLDNIPEFGPEDADYIIDIVDQYLLNIGGTEEDKKHIVRRYAAVILEDIKKQLYENIIDNTEFTFRVERDLIVFGAFRKNIKKQGGEVSFRKEISDKKNIKQYIFNGFKKSYYDVTGFDSDAERRLSVIIEDDASVLKWVRPPLNQLGLFYKAGKQYNPDFVVETADTKYLIEVKADDNVESEDVLDKAKMAIKWCRCASTIEGSKPWQFVLLADKRIVVGNTYKYTIGLAENLEELEDEC